MFSFMPYLAASPLDWARGNIDWIVAAAIVIVCLVVYGGRDLMRLSPLRIRAVASVSFRESIRRRVLWLTPLAIIGVLLVSQFQRPLDEQDAVRQITKFCVFASGMLVTIAAIILACTNLPREIENRVIYTVVTKPTTRIEILLGKILGFAAISASILVIMGLFSWAFLQFHEWRVLEGVEQRLQATELEPPAEQTLRYYAANGLLDARTYLHTNDVQVHPAYQMGEREAVVIKGPHEQEAYVPFVIAPDLIPPGTRLNAFAIGIKAPWTQRAINRDELSMLSYMSEASGVQVQLPDVPAGPQQDVPVDVSKLFPAFIRIGVSDRELNNVVDPMSITGEGAIPAPDPTGQREIQIPFTDHVARAVNQRLFYIRIMVASPGTEVVIRPENVRLMIGIEGQEQPLIVESQKFDRRFTSHVLTLGRVNQNGQQVPGDPTREGSVAVVAYRDVTAPVGIAGQAHFEFRTIVERGGEDPDEYKTTWIEVQVANRQTQQISEPLQVAVESRRSAYFSFPADTVAGGNFDVLIRPMTEGQWISLRPGGIRLAGADTGFGFNLIKSYFILWLFSLLVITISIFCSTFLSWPIAVVLTLLILFGHWGVLQLGEMASPGVGRQVVTDLFRGAAPAVTETLTRSFEGLSAMLRIVSSVLPDISQFAAMEDLEQGVSISARRIGAGLAVLAMFGLPILALSYVIFRNKEVAP